MIFQNEVFYKIARKIDEIFRNVDMYSEIYKIDREQAEKEVQLYSELKTKAALGEKTARTYMINQFTKILSTYLFDLNEENINSIIDFEHICKNHVQIIFELLLEIYDMSVLIEKYRLSTKISEKQIREIAVKEEPVFREKFDSIRSRLKMIALLVYAKEYGQDCIDSLQHHNINEIGVIDKEYIYIVHKGEKIHLAFLSFNDRNIILNIQKKTTQNSAVNYDENNPTVVTAKNNASRITVAGYDAIPMGEELYYNERIFNLKKITLEELKDRYHTINELIYQLLLLNQKGKGAHFVTGADMGIGKSTFLLAMMEKVPDKWGIGILDTQNELQARKKYPWKNILTLIENPKRSIAQCFEMMLKMARDVLYVGEITKPAEVAELVNASLRLNAGVGATMHSLSPFEVVTNIRNLMMRTEMYNNAEMAEADISRGVDLIIHLAKHPEQRGRIIVEYIVEVEHVEQHLYIEPMGTGSFKQHLNHLVRMMQLAVQKYLYPRHYKYNVIVKYDKQKGDWITVHSPTQAYFEKIGKYVGAEEIEKMKSFFNA